MSIASAGHSAAQRGAAQSIDGIDAADVKGRMIQSAVYVLAREGYQGTSFARVLEHSGAPRGSIYYHFPGGKDQLVAAAVEAKFEYGMAELEKTRGKSLTTLLRAISDYWRDILVDSDCTAGCPVVAVSVAATNPEVRTVVAEAFARWRTGYRTALADAGVPRARSGELASLLLSGFEGAVQLARAERSLQVYDDASRAIRRAIIERAGA